MANFDCCDYPVNREIAPIKNHKENCKTGYDFTVMGKRLIYAKITCDLCRTHRLALIADLIQCWFVTVLFPRPGVDLAYLQTGISGVYFWVLNFQNLYFLGTGHSCCIFLVVK